MISSAWEIGGEIGRLSRVVHPWSSRARLIAMLELAAFSDESHTDREVYCVAGYWATARVWEGFDAQWTAELQRRGLTEFHAEDCETGHGEFEGRTDRDEVRRAFASMISGNALLHPVVAGFELRGWDGYEAQIASLRPRAGDPFYFTFQVFLEGVCNGINCFGPDERSAFIFDNRPGMGKVIELYNSLKSDPDPAFRLLTRRLGTVASEDSKRFPGLQAADLLAYEARLYLTGPVLGIRKLDARPVWLRALNRRVEYGRIIPKEKFPELVAELEARGGNAAKLWADYRTSQKAGRDARGAGYRARARTSPAAPQSPEPEPPEETS